MKRSYVVLTAALAFGASASSAFAAPVGMACHIAGTPQVASGGARKPLRLMQRLNAGDKVACGAGAEAIIVLFGSGERFKVAGGEATIGAANISGARSLGKMGGPSARVAKSLGGARLAALTARAQPMSHQKLAASENDLPNALGWMEAGDHLFQWPPIAGYKSFSFTLFDSEGDVVWNARGTGNAVHYPPNLPALKLRQPYVWQVIPSNDARTADKFHWGAVTFLSKADSAQLRSETAALNQQIEATPDDTTPRVMLAALYKEYGVLEMEMLTLESLDEYLRLSDKAGIEDTLIEAYRRLNPLGRMLVMQSSTHEKIAMNADVLKNPTE